MTFAKRTDFDPATLERRDFYRLLTAVVVPRPIAWVSTVSAEGVDNLAPHSFFTVSCTEPPIVQFTTVGRKDSLVNVEQTREFVVNLAGERHFEQINATGTEFPAEHSEFERVGITGEPSALVRPKRVAESPVALECVLHSATRFGDSTVVFGRVVHAAVHAEVLEDGHPRIERLRPLARLGKDEWATIGEVRSIPRIRYAEWPGHYGGQE
ncbi:flavin reductase family protein [Sciscionella marina]|uniref:flavin reductase family protein n=1 Tax=Sciscionella marina TaxID=508770 RepID=UPI000367ECFB|nr:flavin reductase family protein [Sciscionella marina]